MAIAKGKQSVEAFEIKRFIGVAPVSVLAFNPTNKELEKLTGRTLPEEPVYISTVATPEGNEVKNARITLYVRSSGKYNQQPVAETTLTITLFVRQQQRFNSDKTKVQVIDKYGRTSWVTKEELASHAIPKDRNGNELRLDKDYRPCYVGEEEVSNLIRAFLYLEDTDVYNQSTGRFEQNPDLVSEARLDSWDKVFKGDFSELKEVFTSMPTNKFIAMFGIRTNPETGKQYQTAYTEGFLKSSATIKGVESKLMKRFLERKGNGGYKTTEFENAPLHEYIVQPTAFLDTPAKTPATDDMPFSMPSPNEELPW